MFFYLLITFFVKNRRRFLFIEYFLSIFLGAQHRRFKVLNIAVFHC